MGDYSVSTVNEVGFVNFIFFKCIEQRDAFKSNKIKNDQKQNFISQINGRNTNF